MQKLKKSSLKTTKSAKKARHPPPPPRLADSNFFFGVERKVPSRIFCVGVSGDCLKEGSIFWKRNSLLADLWPLTSQKNPKREVPEWKIVSFRAIAGKEILRRLAANLPSGFEM